MNVETANRLQMLRKKNNLSQEELAEKIGISRQAVSKWERAEASPDTDNLILLAKLYGVTLDDLLKTESVHFPYDDSISLRKEDYYSSTDENDGEIYPNGRPCEYKAAEEPAPEKQAAPDRNQETADNVGDFVKNLAEFTVNVSKEAISATSKAMKSANEGMKKGKRLDDFDCDFDDMDKELDRIDEQFDRLGDALSEKFEKMGKKFEKMGEAFGENVEEKFSDTPKKEQKKYPATLLDKLFPIIIVFFYIIFIGVGLAHPMWLIFLFIPAYYIASNTFKKYRAGDCTMTEAALAIFDGIVPFTVIWLFIAAGELFRAYRVSWLVFLLIPIYYIFSAAAKKYAKGLLSPLGAVIFFLNGTVPIIITLLFFLLGFMISFAFSWIVFFFIPVYYITVDHFKKNVK